MKGFYNAGDIVIDYCYVELTSACITALAHFRRDLGAISARSPRDLRAISARSPRDLACRSERESHGCASKVQLGRLEPVAASEGGVLRLELAVLIDQVLELDLINMSTHAIIAEFDR